ncbi:RrF2 family transcriptional regulator [Mariniflexile sp. HNIBRBA6329]|uniref:RrF2 family transcriptional regulator n=1 Tax=Mariniflexile sp. HNIBRBA6329 TaxID=3373088 RepID=UPI003744FD82
MLSKKTKYGLKALTFIARSGSDTPVQVGEIAREEQIPQKFLESILLSLRKTGILGSKKGKHGGYYLRKDPSEVFMTEVMRVLEGPIAMVPCVSLNFYEKCDDCPDEDRCSVNKLMIQVRDSTLEVFKNTTLKDLSNNQNEKK